jgi:hypothetical protein
VLPEEPAVEDSAGPDGHATRATINVFTGNADNVVMAGSIGQLDLATRAPRLAQLKRALSRPLFTDRFDEYAQLDAALRDALATVTTGAVPITVITGMAGIGKTQLAVNEKCPGGGDSRHELSELRRWFRKRIVGCAIYGDPMTDNDRPWEPPLAGTEAEHLVGALERLRTTFRWKADDLGEAGLRTSIGASTLTLGALLKHLARAEDQMFSSKLSGAPLGPPWDTADWDADPDWDFDSAADDTPEQLYALWDDTVQRSRAKLDAALAEGGLDQLVHLHWPGRGHFSLRRLVCDLIEEYGRHTGHADLLREAVDGRVGEDPPAGWHPKSTVD